MLKTRYIFSDGKDKQLQNATITFNIAYSGMNYPILNDQDHLRLYIIVANTEDSAQIQSDLDNEKETKKAKNLSFT